MLQDDKAADALDFVEIAEMKSSFPNRFPDYPRKRRPSFICIITKV
jgi:hypothetical protein